MKSDHQEAEYLSHISLLHYGVRLHYYTKALCGTEFTYHGVAIEGVFFSVIMYPVGTHMTYLS